MASKLAVASGQRMMSTKSIPPATTHPDSRTVTCPFAVSRQSAMSSGFFPNARSQSAPPITCTSAPESAIMTIAPPRPACDKWTPFTMRIILMPAILRIPAMSEPCCRA